MGTDKNAGTVSNSELIRRYAAICVGCEKKDETITHHAAIIARLKKEKLAYRAALIEACPDTQKRRDILMSHMERLDA